MNYFYKTGSDLVFRGGGWSYAEWGCHSSIRSRSNASYTRAATTHWLTTSFWQAS